MYERMEVGKFSFMVEIVDDEDGVSPGEILFITKDGDEVDHTDDQTITEMGDYNVFAIEAAAENACQEWAASKKIAWHEDRDSEPSDYDCDMEAESHFGSLSDARY